MHAAAYEFIGSMLAQHPPRRAVYEMGSRNVNGGVRDLFPGAHYWGVDIAPGHGVDAVGDASVCFPPFVPDTVVCCEVFEHVDDETVRRMVRHAASLLGGGGLFLATCATDPRLPHSGHDGGPLRAGEFYRNVGLPLMSRALSDLFGLHWDLQTNSRLGDLYVVAEVKAHGEDRAPSDR